MEIKVGGENSEIVDNRPDNISSLESAVEQVREEAKEINEAKATADEVKDEGIGNSALVLMELVKPLKSAWPWFQEIIQWERPASTLTVIGFILLVVYNYIGVCQRQGGKLSMLLVTPSNTSRVTKMC